MLVTGGETEVACFSSHDLTPALMSINATRAQFLSS